MALKVGPKCEEESMPSARRCSTPNLVVVLLRSSTILTSDNRHDTATHATQRLSFGMVLQNHPLDMQLCSRASY